MGLYHMDVQQSSRANLEEKGLPIPTYSLGYNVWVISTQTYENIKHNLSGLGIPHLHKDNEATFDCFCLIFVLISAKWF